MRSQPLRGNVFVANLPPDFGDDQLAETFDPFGIVLSASVARDPATGAKLRYGFVDIATERAAQHAVASMNGVKVAGHALDVRISEHQPGKRPARRSPARAMSRPRIDADAEPHRPRRAAPDAALSEPADDDRPARPPRKAPNFVVERRPLPRRF